MFLEICECQCNKEMLYKDEWKTHSWKVKTLEIFAKCIILYLDLCKFNRCRPQELGRILRRYKQKNLNYLQNIEPLRLRFNVKYLIYPDDITMAGADKMMACGKHRSKTSVEQYYFVKHKITLYHSDMPCIVVRGNNEHEYYYPIEILELTDFDEY